MENTTTELPKKKMKWASEINERFMDDFADRIANGSKYYKQTGIPSLDANFPTLLYNDNLTILAARPGMGKTAFAQQVSEHLAVDKTVLMFSLEMPDYQIEERGVAYRAGLSLTDIRTATMDDNAIKDKVMAAGEDWAKLNLLIDDFTTDIDTMTADARKVPAALEKMGLPELSLIVVDYIQLINGGAGGAQNRNLELGKISRSLKLLAKELHVPVLALSQLNRNVEGRTDKRPQMSDLRESGALEQDADAIIFLYRDEVYNPDDEESKGKAEIIISKNRAGQPGIQTTAWLGEKMRFRDLCWVTPPGADTMNQTNKGNGNGQKKSDGEKGRGARGTI